MLQTPAACAFLLGGVWLVGCSQDVQLAHAHADAGRGVAIGKPAPPGGPPEAYCNDADLLQLAAARSDGGSPTCTGLAAQTFRYALCTCGNATFTAALTTDAFDSTTAAHAPGLDGASVGIDGQLISAGAVSVAGSLITTGSGELPITASPFRIAGNFDANGDVIMTGVEVGFDRDARVNGDILAVGATVRIARDLTQTPGHTGADGVSVGGRTLSRDFELAPPCACADDQILDVDAAVRQAANDNADAAFGLTRDALYGSDDGGVFDLPCGRLFFAGGTLSARTLNAHARSAIFIDGDLTIVEDFQPDFGDTGELDVFVRGDLVLGSGIAVGSPERPAALRFYVAGAGAIASVGPLAFAANLYAPRAAWLTSSAQTIYGALFVESYSAAGDQQLHYDRAVLRAAAGEACSPASSSSACSQDLDCAPPFLCAGGRCAEGSD